MKLPVMLFYLFFGITLPIFLIDEFKTKGINNLHTWFLTLIALFLVPGFIFVFPTFRVILDSDGIKATWQLGYGKISLYNYRQLIKWKEVGVVFSLYPIWLPFHIINVNGLWMGSFLTRKKAALLYIADHVPLNVLDEEVCQLIQKYRKQSKE